MARQLKPRGNARFFCEQCGSEVRPGAAACPSCGSVFTAVRCPECGYEGRAPEFKSGCPVCGYATVEAPGSEAGRGAPRRTPAAAPRRRGMPVVFSRIALIALSALVVGLTLFLVLHG